MQGVDEEVISVSIETLRLKGFARKAPNNRIRLHGDLWFKIGPYAFRTIEGSKEIELTKVDDDD